MRKTIAVLLGLTIVFGAYAKNDKDQNEFSITYGQATLPQFAYVFGGVLGAAFTLGHFSFDNSHMLGAAGLEYVHYVNGWLGFGGAVMCDYMTSDAFTVASDGTKTPSGKYNFGFASVMPVVKFAWLNRAHVGLYSKLAFGAGMAFDNGNGSGDSSGDSESKALENVTFAGQVTPVGIDFGGETFRGFVEAGIGMQGVVNAGVRWQF